MNLNTLLFIYNLIIYAFIFLIGICIGSFLNVCIYRIPNNISIAKGRSFCPNCNHQLHALDLVPLFSYLLLGKKCRYCHTSISPRYFGVELLTGILFILVFYKYQFTLLTLLHFFFVSLLIVIAYIDYDTMDIYEYNHILFIILGLIRYLFIKDMSITTHILGTLCISIPLLIIYYIVKDGIGGGDIKLMASCGFYLGIGNTVLSFLIGTISAAVVAVYCLLTKKKNSKEAIAFGPYLCIGFIISILYGQQIIAWYLGLLL